MKTITIPKSFGYPTLDIIINGKKHTLQSGIEITVEDALAEVIENAMALAPKYGRNISKFAQRTEGSILEVNESDLEGITTISSYAFYNCDSLTDVVIPNSVKSIGRYAFSYCDNLVKVVLPESIISIDERAFFDSNNLTRVILKAKTPPSIAANAVEDILSTCVFEVPSESVAAYKTAANWSKIASQIVAIKE